MGTPERIDGVILKQLARGEMRLLILLVSVRKALAGSAPFKGDLSKAVNTALRTTRAYTLGGVWVRDGWRAGTGPSSVLTSIPSPILLRRWTCG